MFPHAAQEHGRSRTAIADPLYNGTVRGQKARSGTPTEVSFFQQNHAFGNCLLECKVRKNLRNTGQDNYSSCATSRHPFPRGATDKSIPLWEPYTQNASRTPFEAFIVNLIYYTLRVAFIIDQ